MKHHTLANNVSNSNPYLTNIESRSKISSGASSMNFSDINFSGKYRVDGLPVPQSFYQMRIESRMVGGAFGILEISSRMSTLPRRKIGEWWRTFETTPTDLPDGTIRGGVTHRYKLSDVYEGNDWWSIVRSLAPFSVQTKPDTYARAPARRLNAVEVGYLRQNIEKVLTDNCKNFISSLITRAAQRANSTAIFTDVLKLFDMVASNRNGPDQYGDYGGIWGFLTPSMTGTGGADSKKNIFSIGLPITNYAIYSSSLPNIDKKQYDALNEKDKLIRNYQSFLDYGRLGMLTTIHELIHISVVGPGDGDLELAEAALSLTGEELNMELLNKLSPREIDDKVSAIWDGRLKEACGGLPRPADKNYIRKTGGR